MVEDLPDLRRRLRAHRTMETRHLPNGIRVAGQDSAAIAVVADVLRSTPEIRFVSQYTYAVPDLRVDTLEQIAGQGPAEPGTGAPDERYDLLGRSMADNMIRLDEELSWARTGRLIRLFLVAERGAAHCTEVSVGRHLAAISLFDAESLFAGARAADRVTASLTNRLRRDLRQRPIDYGGWLAQTVQGTSSTGVDCTHGGRVIRPHVTAVDESVAESCRRHVDCRTLHYVAVHRQGRALAVADVLHHPDLDVFRYGHTAEERRRFYGRLGARMNRYSSDFSVSAEPVIGSSIRHMVLDVERGAVYFHRLDPSTYIVGVTLDQDQVADAELQITALAADLTSA